MANPEHLAILGQGVEVWNQWRQENKLILPILIRADLRGANLNGANLSEADLSEADLSRADLTKAFLFLANLSGAILNEALLSEASIVRGIFRGADLSGSNLSSADLRDANFAGTNLSQASLHGSLLDQAYFNTATLNETNFCAARLALTSFINVDLCEAKGLETIAHAHRSFVDFDTVNRSKGKIPEIFLNGIGLSKSSITYIASLVGQSIQYYSCFISHSSQDRLFAQRLRDDLRSKGVTCYYAPEDMEIGIPLPSGIDTAVRAHDKLLLVLSNNSIQSGWVKFEVELAISKENEYPQRPHTLFPVRIDNAVMNADIPWAKRLRANRNIGDFTNWKDHDAYQKAFDRLLRDLQQSEAE